MNMNALFDVHRRWGSTGGGMCEDHTVEQPQVFSWVSSVSMLASSLLWNSLGLP